MTFHSRNWAHLGSMLAIGLAVGLSLMPRATAGAPLTLNYQGHVSVDGLAFEGAGKFKFALLDGGGQSVWRLLR